jgi:Uri superfamily endonuclease
VCFVRRERGTYALILRCRTQAQIRVGRRGLLDVRTGYYVYVGSAFGPGGVKARVSRHVREKTAKHWHIDFLRDVAAPVAVWCSYGSRDLEHHWARVLCGLPGAVQVPGFGCTDCACETHLFRFGEMPDAGRFSRVAGGLIESGSLENDHY